MAAMIKCDERPFKGGVWGGFALGKGGPLPVKNWGVWGAAPPSQNFSKNRRKNFHLKPSDGNLIDSLMSASEKVCNGQVEVISTQAPVNSLGSSPNFNFNLKGQILICFQLKVFVLRSRLADYRDVYALRTLVLPSD